MIDLSTFSDTYSNNSGEKLFSLIEKKIVNKELIEISFKGASTSSSFLNSSIGSIIEIYGFDSLKKYVIIKHLSISQSTALKTYLDAFKTLA